MSDFIIGTLIALPLLISLGAAIWDDLLRKKPPVPKPWWRDDE